MSKQQIIDPDKLYTIDDAAAVARLSESRLYKAIDGGELAHQVDDTGPRPVKLVRGSVLRDWLANRRRPGGVSYYLVPVRRKPERHGARVSDRTLRIIDDLLGGKDVAEIARDRKVSPGTVVQIKLRELECRKESRQKTINSEGGSHGAERVAGEV